METLIRPRGARHHRALGLTSPSRFPPSVRAPTTSNGIVSTGAFPTVPGAALASVAPSSGWTNWDNPAYLHEHGASRVALSAAQGTEAKPFRFSPPSSLASSPDEDAASTSSEHDMPGSLSPTPALDADHPSFRHAPSLDPASSPAVESAQEADSSSLRAGLPTSLSSARPALKQSETARASRCIHHASFCIA